MVYKLEKDKIIFESAELFPHLPCIGFGGHSDVYKFRIGNEIFALKIYKWNYQESLEKIEEKLSINIDSYISPLRILYVKDKFSGYMMKYCRNHDLEKRRHLDISINEFAKSTAKLIDDTKSLSKLKFLIYDTFISNVMYDEGFKMIDMDDYPYCKDSDSESIEKENLSRLSKMLVNIFVNSTDLATLFFENVEFTKLMSMCNSDKITFEEFFNIICMKAFEIEGNELVDVKDIGKVLKKHKNIYFS